MIVLDTTTRSLEVLLSGAVTTNQLPVVAAYVDLTTTTFLAIANQTATNNTTAVTAVAAPAASTQRQLKHLSVQNADTVSATVTVRLNDNSTTRVLVKITLAANSSLQYNDGEGWRTLDSNGATLTTSAGGGSPFADNAALVKNNSDATKLLIVSAASVTTGTTRTLTAQNASYTLAGLETAQTFTVINTFAESPTSNFGAGSNNERWGSGAGNDAATGNNNNCFGSQALIAVTNGSDNLCLGATSGKRITSGAGNILLGGATGAHLTNGSSNCFVGDSAGVSSSGGAAQNNSLGASTLSNVTGSNNSVIGHFAGVSLTSGTDNVLISIGGFTTTLTTGSFNVTLGSGSDTAASNTQYSIALGYQAVAVSNEFATGPNVNFFSPFGQGNYGSGSNVMFLANGTAPGSNPTGGGLVYVDTGSLKFRGSSGAMTVAGTTVALGGTGVATFASNGVVYGNGTGALQVLAVNASATNKFLTQSSSAAPAWATIVTGDIPAAALTKTDDTNVTLTLGGTPTTALLVAASLTLGWTGTLAVARGGSGAGTFTANGVLYGNTTSAIQVTAAGTNNQVLVGNTSAAPSFRALTYSDLPVNTLDLFTPLDNQPPASNYALLGSRNNHATLEYDDTTNWDGIFGGVLPRSYQGGNIVLAIAWAAATATSGAVGWQAAFERLDANDTALGTDNFASAQSSSFDTTNGTSGKLTVSTITFTSAQIGGCVAGDAFRLKVTRNAASGSDTMGGKAQIISCELKG